MLDNTHYTPILDKTRGAKEHKLIYAKRGSPPTKNVTTTKKERQA